MDIREALEAADIEYRDGKDENEIWLNCPFCIEEGELNLDERFRLGVNVANGKMGCFNCGKKGYGEYTFQELQRVLDTGELEGNESKRKKKRRIVLLPEGFELLHQPNGNKHEWDAQAWRYIRKRGVTEKQIIEKKIGYTVIGDYHHRIVAPIYRHTKLLGFVGRDITDKMELKYLNSVGDKAIYNLPDSTNHKSICLSEGFFDALAIERGSLKLGIDSGALLGHDIKDDQLELLHQMGYKYYYVWMDPDDAGVKGTISIAKKINNERTYIVVPRGFRHEGANDSDPGELESNVVKQRLQNAARCTPELLDKLRAYMLFEED